MMKIQFSNKNMTVPDRVYSHAEQRINELDHLFRGEPVLPDMKVGSIFQFLTP